MRLSLVAALLVTGVSLFAADAPTPPSAPKPAAIRSFPTDTLAQLGRDIYRHEQLASSATDELYAKVKPDDLVKDGARGWIVEANGAKPYVRFLRERNGFLEASYDVVVPDSGAPVVSVPTSRSLTPIQEAEARALETARKAIADGKHPWCGGRANTVVLPDPSGDGFLVYLLRSKPSAAEVPIGGHYRITVSANGRSVMQIDQLFASCLTLSKSDIPAGSKVEAMTMSSIVSDTPLETHVWLSLQEKMTFYVGTAGGKNWRVDQGRIVPFDPKPAK